MKSYRIDPAFTGIHIVDVVNGGIPVLIPWDEINDLIKDLREVTIY